MGCFGGTFVPPTRSPHSLSSMFYRLPFYFLPCPSSEACLCPVPCLVYCTHGPNTQGLRSTRTLQLQELRGRTLRRLERPNAQYCCDHFYRAFHKTRGRRWICFCCCGRGATINTTVGYWTSPSLIKSMTIKGGEDMTCLNYILVRTSF